VDSVNPIFGPAVPPEFERVLNVGLEEIPPSRLTELADDLWRAQTMLIGAAYRAAIESGRVEHVCPDTPDELLNPERVTLRIRKEPA
jgi:hypothetical protein